MHYKEVDEVFSELRTSKSGISEEEAQNRLKQYGRNEIKEGKRTSSLTIFLSQFKNVVIWILIVATVISVVLGYLNPNKEDAIKDYIDALVIVIIIVMIAAIGFFQEFKAERAIEALKKMASLKANVIRDGQRKEIDSKDLVPGDAIILQTGDKIPADSRIIEAFNFQTQEAALTGESTPVKKDTKAVEEKTALADRKDIAFSGTIVVSGRAIAIVSATGMNTEIGKIATMIQQVESEPTPLQKKMDGLAKLLGKIVISIAVVITFVGMYFQDKPFLEMLEFGAAVAVAAIPEALAGVVTIALAVGTQRMLKRNALIRHLPSVETLGSTTVICTDKTGTLTANQMTVRKIFANGRIMDISGVGYDPKGQFTYKGKAVNPLEVELLLKIGAANNDAEIRDEKVIGDPTEGALIVSAAKIGLLKSELEKEMPRIDEVEFTSERKMMTTIHRHHGEKVSYVKGAPEVILKLCSYININGKTRKITEEDKMDIINANIQFADQALRVLGFAYKSIVSDINPERGLTFVGLQAMIDPPREEVKVAIDKCKKAGIKVIMITGDHETTARAVAREIGLEGKTYTGKQLDEMESLDDVVEDTAVFARVNPEHKIKIVDALKKKGHVVAMTGDGVNDAPALKKADIGIAMGIAGTDVAKEASSMILLDDNFASIVNAVEEGRGVYDNIRKYIGFLLSGNIGEVMIVFLGIIFGLPLTLTATQILLINLVTDGLPALALTVDPFEPNAMQRKPKKQSESIFKGLNPFLIYYPIIQVTTSLSIFIYVWKAYDNVLMAQTATFLTIGMFELYQSFASRSTIYPAMRVGIFRNKWLIVAFLASFFTMAASIYIPSLGHYLDMAPLDFGLFIFIVLISSLGAIAIEICKWYKTRNEAILD